MAIEAHTDPTHAAAGSPCQPRLFPAFLKLGGRRVLVVGGGAVAASKLGGLIAAGAEVTVVAPRIAPEILAAPVRTLLRPFEPADLDDVWFVVAAATPEVNRRVAREAEARRVFVNAVDDPANASAYAGGVLRRDGVVIAISTEGAAPALAGLLREALEALLPADLARWSAVARALRPQWKAAGIPLEARRPLLLEALEALYARRDGTAAARGRDREREASA